MQQFHVDQEVRVLDENGTPGKRRPEWAGRVTAVSGAVAEVAYGDVGPEQFHDGRRGSRYLLPKVVHGYREHPEIPRFGADQTDNDYFSGDAA